METKTLESEVSAEIFDEISEFTTPELDSDEMYLSPVIGMISSRLHKKLLTPSEEERRLDELEDDELEREFNEFVKYKKSIPA